MISKTDIGDTWSEGAKVLAKLYVEANEFCTEKNMALERISEESAPGRVFVRNARTLINSLGPEEASRRSSVDKT